MVDNKSSVKENRPPPLKGGPLGLGDPDDTRLRKTERDVIIPKMALEEAEKKCSEHFQEFFDCAKEAGLLVVFKCKQQNNAKNECISQWLRNPEFLQQITDKYINARNHYRRTGEPLIKYVRNARHSGGGFC